MTSITIYTDGAAKGNPGPGGYGAILQSGPHYKEISQGFRLTTNNRMELLSVIVCLEMLKQEGCEVMVFSDSKYVVDAVEVAQDVQPNREPVYVFGVQCV